MIVVVRGDPQRHSQALRKQAQADRHDQRPRNEAQNRIELLGNHVTRGEERDQAEREHSDRVRYSDRRPLKRRMLRRAARTDQIRADDRFAMPGRHRVHSAQREGYQQPDQYYAGSQARRGDQFREPVARDHYRPAIAQRQRLCVRGRRPRGGRPFGDAFVERRHQQVFGVSPQLIGHAAAISRAVEDLRARSGRDNDLAPARPLGRIDVLEAEPWRRARNRELAGQFVNDAQREQPGRARLFADALPRQTERDGGAVNGQLQPGQITGRDPIEVGVQLGFGEIAVAVQIGFLRFLKGGDFGQVDDVANARDGGPGFDAREVVDREITQRVGGYFNEQADCDYSQ